ncbi:MAG: chorismate mutase [Candidatus Nanosalina sp.]
MSLEEAREEIDEANRKIVNDVRERMDAVLKVMDHKEREDIQIRDREREEEVKKQFEDLFEKKNLPEGRGEELAEVLIETAVDIQKDILDR